MPPKLKAASLAHVTPTKEELELAQSVKAKKSKMASMVHWLKSNPDEAIEKSRGEARQAYLMKFLVHQMRQKATTKTTTSKTTTSTTNQTSRDVFWWSAEKMNQELGTKKGESWRQSGKLRTRPDPVTNSSDPDFLEHAVPVEWTRLVTGEENTLSVTAEGEATEEDVGMADFAPEGTAPETAVKSEPLTPEEEMQKQIEKITKDAPNELRRFQEFLLESKLLNTQIENMKYAETLAGDNTKHMAKLARAIKVIEMLVTGKAANKQELPKLVDTMASLEAEHREIESWAEKFGRAMGARAKKARKR
eukprot:CAMPEP_0170304954 /NCGR_PEP_ID=MMETSP0116_2-20130129/52833_1 /TAXON_ID=400756 /ORGANISM="Durinskia baltica, Strain CSIRO CS-38" /LENGTH=305 /DNA_ID=CAMNT_0010556969 /DNA_START=6 /DNA_END=924 /DNA_ORIENTATION=-